ncbi:MAG: SIS domain-containing protein [Gemmatimonadaceae bacterium]|nr:SIS domain-containing protein [Gemmatimonadaceae bacterium]
MSSNYVAEHFNENLRVVEKSVAALAEPVSDASNALVAALRDGGKLVCFGNGGSASQASHMVGELIGRFKSNRRPLPAVALGSDPAAVTCIANDFGYDALFERQAEALARKGDVALGLTTSGRSENVLRALAVAKKNGAVTIALCGEKGLARGDADFVLSVPSAQTAHIQEVHLMILHTMCIAVEDAFPEDGKKA